MKSNRNLFIYLGIIFAILFFISLTLFAFNQEPRGVVRKEVYQTYSQQDFLSAYIVYYYDNQYLLRKEERYNQLDILQTYTLYYYGVDQLEGLHKPYYKPHWRVKEEEYNAQGDLTFERSIEYHRNDDPYIHKGRCYDYEVDTEYFYKYYYETFNKEGNIASDDRYQRHPPEILEGDDFRLEEVAYFDTSGNQFASERIYYDHWDRAWIKVRYGASGDLNETEYNTNQDTRLQFGIPYYYFYEQDYDPLIIKNYVVYHYDGLDRVQFKALFDHNNYVYEYHQYEYNLNNEPVKITQFEGYTYYRDYGWGLQGEFEQTQYKVIYNDILVPTFMEFVESQREGINIPSGARPPEELQE